MPGWSDICCLQMQVRVRQKETVVRLQAPEVWSWSTTGSPSQFPLFTSAASSGFSRDGYSFSPAPPPASFSIVQIHRFTVLGIQMNGHQNQSGEVEMTHPISLKSELILLFSPKKLKIMNTHVLFSGLEQSSDSSLWNLGLPLKIRTFHAHLGGRNSSLSVILFPCLLMQLLSELSQL